MAEQGRSVVQNVCRTPIQHRSGGDVRGDESTPRCVTQVRLNAGKPREKWDVLIRVGVEQEKTCCTHTTPDYLQQAFAAGDAGLAGIELGCMTQAAGCRFEDPFSDMMAVATVMQQYMEVA